MPEYGKAETYYKAIMAIDNHSLVKVKPSSIRIMFIDY
jgi:hypothetical protein